MQGKYVGNDVEVVIDDTIQAAIASGDKATLEQLTATAKQLNNIDGGWAGCGRGWGLASRRRLLRTWADARKREGAWGREGWAAASRARPPRAPSQSRTH